MNRILVIGTDSINLEEALIFAELCRWLADSQPVREVMESLAKHDLDRMECFGRCALQADMADFCGELPVPGLTIMREYCALSRKRCHARAAFSGTGENSVA